MLKELIKKIKKHKLILFSIAGVVILCFYINSNITEKYNNQFTDVDEQSSSNDNKCYNLDGYLKQQQQFNDMTDQLNKIKELQDKEIEKRIKEKQEKSCGTKTTMKPLTDEQLKNYLKGRMKDKLDTNFDDLVNQQFNDILHSFGSSRIKLNENNLLGDKRKLHKHLHNFHGDNSSPHSFESHHKRLHDTVDGDSHMDIKKSKISDSK